MQIEYLSHWKKGWLEIIDRHLKRYPAMTSQDVYKLLYQGIFGPEHLMPSAESFTAFLKEELAHLTPDRQAPLFEDIRPDGTLRRIYLRPWLATGQDIAELAETCLEAGRRTWGIKAELIQIWEQFIQQVECGNPPSISGQDLQNFNIRLQSENYPPMHHSASYLSLYQPAYRLVSQ